jgi:hypothetical protein
MFRVLLTNTEIAGNTIQPDSIEIYESLVPTTYLALLATRRQEDSRTVGAQIKKPRGEKHGIALVYPYVMLPLSPPASQWGMVLESPGKLYEQYATSIIRFFEEGQNRGYLRRIWPEA